MSDVRFRVLGVLEVIVDGRQSPIPPGRRRAVLACLLVHAGQPVHADSLIEAAWGDDGLPHDPQASLHTVLSRLRALVGQGVIEAGPAGYRLVTEPGGVDAKEFEERVASALTEEPAQARVTLAGARELWRGPAFGEYADASFAVAEATRLERLRMDAVEAHAAACLDSGDPGAAVAGLEALLAEEPFREHAVELLMTALYRSGRQAEALGRFRDHRRTLAEELGLEPAPVLTDLEVGILGHRAAPGQRADTSVLPTWLDTSTAFIGREDELAALVNAVATNRVTVLTGPGGVGKSRLAAEALVPVHDRLGLPVAVVELARVARGGVVSAVADSLRLRPGEHALTRHLVEYLGAVPHLLVLDNCEHLLDEVAPLVASVGATCRSVRVLATSRRRLGVTAERVLPLEPLAVPDRSGGVTSQTSAALRLIGDRIRRLQPTFSVTTDNVADLAELCRRLDGLPLALELAASRIATLGVAELLAQVPTELVTDQGAGASHEQSPRRSTGAPGGTDDLHPVVAWSYRLLEGDHRELLTVLSVFTGEFTIDAVRDLTAYVPSWRGDPHVAFAELVESSLVARRLDGAQVRYRLLAAVRAFAMGRLMESGRASQAHLAHATWTRDVVSGIAADWATTDGAIVGARLTDAAPEAAAAIRCALDCGQIRLAAEIVETVALCMHWTPGPSLTNLFIEVGERGIHETDPALAGGVAAGAFFAAERGEVERAHRLGMTALDLADEPSALTCVALAVPAMYAGRHEDAIRWFEQLAAIPRFRGEANTSLSLIACYADNLDAAREHVAVALAAGPSGSDASQAFATYAAGEVEARTDPARGALLLSAAADEATRVGAEQVSRVSRVALFALQVRTGQHDAAVELGGQLLADLRRLDAWTQVWTVLRMLAELLAETGNDAEAAFLLAAADNPAAPPLVGLDVERYAALRAGLTEQLGQGVSEQIRSLAAATPRAQVLSRADWMLRDWTRSTATPDRVAPHEAPRLRRR